MVVVLWSDFSLQKKHPKPSMLHSVHFAMNWSFFKDRLRSFCCCEELHLPADAWSYLWVCGDCVVFRLAFWGDKLLVLPPGQQLHLPSWLRLRLDYRSQWQELQIAEELMKALDCSDKKTGYIYIYTHSLGACGGWAGVLRGSGTRCALGILRSWASASPV